AICCGSKMPKHSPTWSLFRHLGLAHLLVVSGYHLILIEKAITIGLGSFKSLARKSYLFLFPLLVICQFQPPIMRAFLSICLKSFNQHFRFYWNSSSICLFTGLICLLLFPQWLNSLSFQISWGASLIMCIPIRGWRRGLAFFLGLYPFLSFLGVAHPLSLIPSVALAPFVALPLIVLSWLVLLIPSQEYLIREGMKGLVEILGYLGQWIPPPLLAQNLYFNYWSWTWLIFLFGVSFLWEVTNLRRAC
ncbi:MAG: ComEC/Rec2 family competence protein, partial [Bdellovibrionales bacterium]|nr:ComEC/Rec2 family competence protein [Bdellovibrionales bacterium]